MPLKVMAPVCDNMSRYTSTPLAAVATIVAIGMLAFAMMVSAKRAKDAEITVVTVNSLVGALQPGVWYELRGTEPNYGYRVADLLQVTQGVVDSDLAALRGSYREKASKAIIFADGAETYNGKRHSWITGRHQWSPPATCCFTARQYDR